MESPSVHFGIPRQWLYRILWIAGFLNVLVLCGTTLVLFVYPRMEILPSRFSSPTWLLILSQLNISGENTVVTWYSSMLLFTTGVLAFICYGSKKDSATPREKLFLKGWIIIGLMFFLLSLDELGSIHESIGNLHYLDVIGDSSWESVLAIPVAAVVIYLIIFSWIHLRKHILTFVFMILGTVLFASVPFQEHLEFSMLESATNKESYARPIYMVLFEEGAELFGTLSFMISMVLYSLDARTFNKNNQLTVNFSTASLLRNTVVGVIVLSILFLFSFQLAGQLKYDEGIAINWFPAVTVMMIAVTHLLFFRNKYKWYIFLYSCMWSCYFGINFYPLLAWEDISGLVLLVRIIMIPGLIFYLYALSTAYKNKMWKLMHIVPGVFVLPAFIFVSEFVTVGVVSGMVIIWVVKVSYIMRPIGN
jgi:hypothetical protein